MPNWMRSERLQRQRIHTLMTLSMTPGMTYRLHRNPITRPERVVSHSLVHSRAVVACINEA